MKMVVWGEGDREGLVEQIDVDTFVGRCMEVTSGLKESLLHIREHDLHAQ